MTAAGFDLHAVLRSKIALTTLALMLIRAVLCSVEQLHRAAIVVAVASAAAGLTAASLRKFYVIDAWALIGAVVQIGVLTRRRPKPEDDDDDDQLSRQRDKMMRDEMIDEQQLHEGVIANKALGESAAWPNGVQHTSMSRRLGAS